METGPDDVDIRLSEREGKRRKIPHFYWFAHPSGKNWYDFLLCVALFRMSTAEMTERRTTEARREKEKIDALQVLLLELWLKFSINFERKIFLSHGIARSSSVKLQKALCLDRNLISKSSSSSEYQRLRRNFNEENFPHISLLFRYPNIAIFQSFMNLGCFLSSGKLFFSSPTRALEEYQNQESLASVAERESGKDSIALWFYVLSWWGEFISGVLSESEFVKLWIFSWHFKRFKSFFRSI